MGILDRDQVGLTYHIGVNTATKYIRGYSPIINGRGFWIPLPRSIDRYTVDDLVYIIGQHEISLRKVIEYSGKRGIVKILTPLDNVRIHIDPDFYSGTYGEYWKPYPIIKVWNSYGSFPLFFIGSFKREGSSGFWGLLGHMVVDELLDLRSGRNLDPVHIISRYRYNAHIVRVTGKVFLGGDDLDREYIVDRLVKIIGDRDNVFTGFIDELRRHTRILVSSNNYCIYDKPIPIWTPRGGEYGELFRRGIILKQVMYSRAYTMINPYKFVEWAIDRIDLVVWKKDY